MPNHIIYISRPTDADVSLWLHLLEKSLLRSTVALRVERLIDFVATHMFVVLPYALWQAMLPCFEC